MVLWLRGFFGLRKLFLGHVLPEKKLLYIVRSTGEKASPNIQLEYDQFERARTLNQSKSACLQGKWSACQDFLPEQYPV